LRGDTARANAFLAETATLSAAGPGFAGDADQVAVGGDHDVDPPQA
jgi:hypothetical protein